ncbi:hypothetical protein ES705_20316 [subsurface metagenome]
MKFFNSNNLDPISDKALMLKVKAGDIDKLGLLYERYNKSLFGFFLRMSGSTEVSEDLVQTVFHRILEKRRQYKGKGKFTSWMYQIAHNLWSDSYKKNKRLSNTNDFDNWDLKEGLSIDEQIAKEEQLQQLKYALDTNKEELVIPLSNPGEPGTLECRLISGSIEVAGYNCNDVVIQAVQRSTKINVKLEELEVDVDEDYDNEIRKEKPEIIKGLRKISAGSFFNLSAEEEDNKIEVSSRTYNHTIDLTIKVPQNFSLELGTVNHGHINVDNVTGNHEIRNVYGSISLNNISGSVLANTVNGKISVVFNTIEPDTHMSFTNMNGDVDITIPANLKVTAKMKSTMGDIYTDFDMEIEKRRVEKDDSEESGTYKISIEDWIYGKINGGGPEFTLKSFNGNIYLRKKQ